MSLVCQAFVTSWDGEDEPKGTLYERAADIHVHQKAARGWGTRDLRDVADRLWLGAEFAAVLPDRAALERVAVVSMVSALGGRDTTCAIVGGILALRRT